MLTGRLVHQGATTAELVADILRTPVTKFDFWGASMTGDGTRFPVIRGPGKDNQVRFSPGGRFIPCQTGEGAETRVYVTPFPTDRGRRQIVSQAPGSDPRWRADGRSSTYSSPDRNLMAVPITTDIIAGRPLRLFGGRYTD